MHAERGVIRVEAVRLAEPMKDGPPVAGTLGGAESSLDGRPASRRHARQLRPLASVSVRALCAAAAVLALIVAGCGGKKNTPPAQAPTTPPVNGQNGNEVPQ